MTQKPYLIEKMGMKLKACSVSGEPIVEQESLKHEVNDYVHEQKKVENAVFR